MSGVKKFIPLLDRILIERVSAQATSTSGGIFIPTQTSAISNNAKVIAIGTGVQRNDGSFVEPLVREGDMVIISPRARATPIPMGDKTYHLITETDILGVIEN